MNPILIPLVAGFAALGFVGYLVAYVLKQSQGTERMAQLSGYVQQGAQAFLKREYTYILMFLVAVVALFSLLGKIAPDYQIDWKTGLAFLIGSICSAVAGYIGMMIATRSNARTAHAASEGGLHKALDVAISGGAVMGMSVVGVALVGLCVTYMIFFQWPEIVLGADGKPEWGAAELTRAAGIINGFAMGASLVALFARCGGGIFTKGADMGADLVGKVEAGIPEDDPRNPAVIADNVGDNVGDVAGLGSDLMESYVESIIVTMALAVTICNSMVRGAIEGNAGRDTIDAAIATGKSLAFLPLYVATAGVIGSIIGVFVVKKLGETTEPLEAGDAEKAAPAAVSSLKNDKKEKEAKEAKAEAKEAKAEAEDAKKEAVEANLEAEEAKEEAKKAKAEEAASDSDSDSDDAKEDAEPEAEEAKEDAEKADADDADDADDAKKKKASDADAEEEEEEEDEEEEEEEEDEEEEEEDDEEDEDPNAPDPQGALMMGTYVAAGFTIVATFFICLLFGSDYTEIRVIGEKLLEDGTLEAITDPVSYGWYGPFLATVLGILSGAAVGFITEYYTSAKYKPVRRIAKSSQSGPALTVTEGLSVGMASTGAPVVILALAVIGAYWIAGMYGVGMAALGMLATTGIIVAVDSYGPIADNAGGIAEMAHMDPGVRKITDNLDAVGNTTAAIGKGFAIGSAAFAALGLIVAYTATAGVTVANITDPTVLAGLLIGAMLPYVFSSLLFDAVSASAFGMINEVRRQFKDTPGLKEGKEGVEADYASCVSIATDGAIKGMLVPGAAALLAPLVIGLSMGKEALAGMLVGALASGVMLGIQCATSGGAMDNAKKFVEEGNYGGKNSDTHKATVIGDTVGDPLKDTVGPSINILIKLMAVIALVLAPLFK